MFGTAALFSFHACSIFTGNGRLRLASPLQSASRKPSTSHSHVDLSLTVYSHPTEPQCSYDPVDGLPLATDTGPFEKIKVLEEQLSKHGTPLFRLALILALRPIKEPTRRHKFYIWVVHHSNHFVISCTITFRCFPRTQPWGHCSSQCLPHSWVESDQ